VAVTARSGFRGVRCSVLASSGLAVVVLGVGVGVGFVSAAPGPAAVASGKIVFGWSSRSAGTVESGTLTYVVSGPMMDEKAGAAYKPTVFPAGYRSARPLLHRDSKPLLALRTADPQAPLPKLGCIRRTG